MISTTVILAGGYATRLYPVTKTIPKAMLQVAGKPFINHQLTLLKKNGISRVVICSGYLSKQIEDYVGNGSEFGLTIKYSIDGEKLLGTGGAIKKALPLLEDKFFVIYGDAYLDVDFKQVSEFFLCRSKKGLMTVFHNMDKWNTSNVVFVDGKLVKYDKKEKTRNMEYIDFGLSILTKAAFEENSSGEIFDLKELFESLINEGQLIGYEVKDRFYDLIYRKENRGANHEYSKIH
jgi:MurNAc alpha-1-phosphate uridylyltransferase